MPRRGNIAKRDVLPDPVYNSKLVTKLVNRIMLDGKKGTAQKILYGAFAIVEKKTGEEALEVFGKALSNITPIVELKVRRIGGANFQVPTELRPERKVSVAMKNLIQFARKRSGHSMAEKLCAEIVAAFNNEGGAFKRKEDMHRMAEANKAFAHFRF